MRSMEVRWLKALAVEELALRVARASLVGAFGQPDDTETLFVWDVDAMVVELGKALAGGVSRKKVLTGSHTASSQTGEKGGVHFVLFLLFGVGAWGS